MNVSVTSSLTEAERAVACASACDEIVSLLLTLVHPDFEGTPRFKRHAVVSHHHTDIHLMFVHGIETFVLTCGGRWVLPHWSVRLEKRVIRVSW